MYNLLTLRLDECCVNRCFCLLWNVQLKPTRPPITGTKAGLTKIYTADSRSVPALALTPHTLCCPPVLAVILQQNHLAASYLCMCVCEFEFHVLVKFSFGQQIEQHQVTYDCGLEMKTKEKCTAFGLLFCRRCVIVDVWSRTTPKIPTPEPMAVSVGIISNFLACEAQITFH